MRILQLTDLHLFADSNHKFFGVNTQESFLAVLDLIKQDIAANSADLILISGDLSQDHSEQSYQWLCEQLKVIDIPIAWTPGNHDKPENIKLLGQAPELINDKHIILNSWQIILLNSMWPHHISGKLDDEQLAFLDETLASNLHQYAMIVLHHNILPNETHWLDQSILINSDEFLAIIKKYPQVKIISYGHIHQEIHINHENIDFYATPSTSIQFKQHSDKFTLDNVMPGYRWFELNDNGTFESKIMRAKFDENFLPQATNALGY